jgi:hemoglobin
MKKILTILLFVSIVAAGLSSCGSSSSSSSTTSTTGAVSNAADVYTSLGGDKAVATIVDKTLNYASNDARIGKYLTSSTKPLVKTVLTSEICNAIGGPCDHSAISLQEALKDTGFNAASGNALMENIGKALDDMKLSADAKNKAMGSLATNLLKGM